MKAIPIFLFFNLWWAFSLHAGDTLTVGQVRALALQTSPLQQKKALAESVAALQLRNIRSNNLPRIQEVPKDQYKLSIDASQRLWDGGSDRYQRRQRELERDITATQTDVDVFQLREIVTDLYFNALLLQENEAVLAASLENLQNRLRQTEAAVAGGVALRTNADQIRIQILQTQQQIANARANQQSLKSILAVWIGRQDTDFQLQTPNAELPTSNFKLSRPEHRLFDLQYSQLQLAQDMLRLKTQPRVELFAQGGFGRPNPFNFFETGFEPFAIFGVRALWTPIDWGNRDRDRQVLTLQALNIDAQRQAFDQRLEAVTRKDRADREKALAQLAQDDAIIALQEDIVRRAEAQVQNGVMTTTDYLAQLNLLTQVRLTRKTHEIQAFQAQEMLNAKIRPD
jgi:outer membrane protein